MWLFFGGIAFCSEKGIGLTIVCEMFPFGLEPNYPSAVTLVFFFFFSFSVLKKNLYRVFLLW